MINDIAKLDQIRDDCRKMVTRRALISAGAAVVPIPGADLVADVGLLTNLLPAVSKRFELDHEKVEKLDPNRAQQILVIASSLGNGVIGRLVTKELVIKLLRRVGMRVATASAAKYVPVVGSALAGGLSFGAMKLVGNAHIDDCYKTARAMIVEAPPRLATR